MTTETDARQLRKAARLRRRSLDKFQQRKAARLLLRLLRVHPWFHRARRIAFYQASAREGEIDPGPLLRLALRHGKRCYLPVMRRDGPDSLMFIRYRKGDRLRRGRYGLMQPIPLARRRIPPRALDLVLVPLVVFDPRGNRMGMGKGFYDRTFAFKRGREGRRPLLLGLAHECQKAGTLNPAPWDVRLDGVATPERIYGERIPGSL